MSIPPSFPPQDSIAFNGKSTSPSSVSEWARQSNSSGKGNSRGNLASRGSSGSRGSNRGNGHSIGHNSGNRRGY